MNYLEHEQTARDFLDEADADFNAGKTLKPCLPPTSIPALYTHSGERRNPVRLLIAYLDSGRPFRSGGERGEYFGESRPVADPEMVEPRISGFRRSPE